MRIRTTFRELNDKARILKNIIVWLEMGSGLNYREEKRETIVGERIVKVNWDGTIRPQFTYTTLYDADDKNPPTGSIVKCMTNPEHDWGVSRFISHEGDHYVLQEIGSKRILNMFNERLDVLIGVPWHVVAEGWEYRMHGWAIKALSPRWNKHVDAFDHRFRGDELHDGVLTIKVGPHIWKDTVHKKVGDRTEVYRYRRRSFDIPVGPKTRLKDIVKSLCDQNFNAPWTEDELELDVKSTENLNAQSRRFAIDSR